VKDPEGRPEDRKAGQHRRRGTNLERAIYAAALDLATRDGYGALTFANVANAAHTSRSVIYRKWPSPFALLHDAVIDWLRRSGAGVVLLDTEYANGNLRDDLIQLMSDFAGRADLVQIRLLIQGMYAELANNSNEILEFVADHEKDDLLLIDRILQPAHERGECPAPEEIPRRVRLLPFEILRYRLVFLGEATDSADIVEIADQIVLPLLTAERPG
jgi:AcrR family transcriptional regulator